MLAARLVTAIALLALFCAGLLFLPNTYWGALLLAGLAVGAWEWAVLVRYRRVLRWLFVGVVAASGAALLLYPDVGVLRAPLFGLSAVFWAVIAWPWLAGKWQPRNALALGATGWFVLVPTWLALTTLQGRPGELLAMLAVIWIADTAAYFAGRRFGRHRLAPQISPGKTWEGVMGAALAVAVYYCLLWAALGGTRTPTEVVAGLMAFGAVTALSIEGDLFESWMKRQAGVKDSGTLLPGHGGVLDRIDGLTAGIPFAALWLHYFGRSGIF